MSMPVIYDETGTECSIIMQEYVGRYEWVWFGRKVLVSVRTVCELLRK